MLAHNTQEIIDAIETARVAPGGEADLTAKVFVAAKAGNDLAGDMRLY